MKKHFWFPKALNLKEGYILVITVLFIGAILVATTTSLLLLGWAAEQNGVVYNQTNQALEAARGCTDIAIQELRKDHLYGGGETYALPASLGACAILAIQGSGWLNREICTEGTSGTTTRRLLTKVSTLFPNVTISFSEEVDASVDCGGAAGLSSSSAPPGGSSSTASSIAAGSSSAASSIAGSSAASSDVPVSSAASSAATCGNSTCLAPEACDDGNTLNGDGCSSTCTIEAMCTCSLCAEGPVQSVCVCDSQVLGSSSAASSAGPVCGDTTCEAPSEACDDGNVFAGDGCSGTCQVETGWECSPICGGGLQSCSLIPASSSSDGGIGGLGGFGPVIGPE